MRIFEENVTAFLADTLSNFDTMRVFFGVGMALWVFGNVVLILQGKF